MFQQVQEDLRLQIRRRQVAGAPHLQPVPHVHERLPIAGPVALQRGERVRGQEPEPGLDALHHARAPAIRHRGRLVVDDDVFDDGAEGAGPEEDVVHRLQLRVLAVVQRLPEIGIHAAAGNVSAVLEPGQRGRGDRRGRRGAGFGTSVASENSM